MNNTYDSVSVENFKRDFIEDACGNSYEIHAFETISSKSSELTDYVVVAGGLFKDFNETPNSGTQIYDDFSTTTSMANYQIRKFDSLFIFDTYYKKVLRVEIENDHTENNNKSIYFINSEFGFLRHDFNYDFIKRYCKTKNIELADDYPEDKLISTMTIDSLTVKNEKGNEIRGVGNQISGMDSEGFEITLLGVPYPFFEEEFPHHVKAYNEMFKEEERG